jgi:ubiquinone/menaquinone biosynthesis C-methylase UbiE
MALNHRRLWLPEMEGRMARWYDRTRGTESQLLAYRQQARALTAGLAAGATVLEVAPGPGYLAIEIAKLGRFQVSGLDISRTFVAIERQHATEAGVTVQFRVGDVAAMPFDAKSFDLIVCQAAFKNFRRPVTALNEMHRVLRDGGIAVIQDMRKEASGKDIAAEVAAQGQRGLNAVITKLVLRQLRRRAYSEEGFRRLVVESAFKKGTVTASGIGLEVRLQ